MSYLERAYTERGEALLRHGVAGEITEVHFDEDQRISAIYFDSGTTHWRVTIDYPVPEMYDIVVNADDPEEPIGALYHPPHRPRLSVGRIA